MSVVMSMKGPILIIEDDSDDRYLLEEAFHSLKVSNPRVYFTNTDQAFTFLQSVQEQPFLIICDVNLPKENGIEFKKRIDKDENLREKSIPFFVFMSTHVDTYEVSKAYTDMTIQGFFAKPDNYEDLKRALDGILFYWSICYHPNHSLKIRMSSSQS